MDNSKHSGFGIASFIISIIAGILTFLDIAVAGMIEVSTPGGMDEKSVSAALIALFLFAFFFIAFVALALGIAGLFQKDRRKIFASLGTAFSAATLLGTAFVIILGLAMK